MQFCVYFTVSLAKIMPWFLKVRVLLLLIQASWLVSFILINVCLQSLSSTQLFVQLFYFTRSSIPNKQCCCREAHTTSTSQAYYNWRLVLLAWLACEQFVHWLVGGFPPSLELISSGSKRMERESTSEDVRVPAGSPSYTASSLLLL